MTQHPFHRLSTISGELPSGISPCGIVFYRVGFLVFVTFWGNVKHNGNSGENGYIPNGYRPDTLVQTPLGAAGSGNSAWLAFLPSGDMRVSGTANHYISGRVVYHTIDPLII